MHCILKARQDLRVIRWFKDIRLADVAIVGGKSAELFDGFSIESNDLTQLTLGVDRDSEIVAFDFDERDPGMLAMLRFAITGAKRNRRHVGDLRRGAGQLAGNCAFPDRVGDRLDQSESRERHANDCDRARGRNERHSGEKNNWELREEQLSSMRTCSSMSLSGRKDELCLCRGRPTTSRLDNDAGPYSRAAAITLW
jgi:hypothetical protein